MSTIPQPTRREQSNLETLQAARELFARTTLFSVLLLTLTTYLSRADLRLGWTLILGAICLFQLMLWVGSVAMSWIAHYQLQRRQIVFDTSAQKETLRLPYS